MASPNNPDSAVKDWFLLQDSQKNLRRVSRENRLVNVANDNLKHESGAVVLKRWHPNVTLPLFINYSSPFCGNSDALPAISSATSTMPVSTIRHSHDCIGINSDRIITFSSKSFKNKGICLKYWTFTVSDGKFRSANCNYTVSSIGEQCTSCMEVMRGIRADKHPELFETTEVTPLAVVTPAPNLIQKLQQLNANDKEFSSPPIISSIKALCLIHRYAEPVMLADKTWLLFCPNVDKVSEYHLYIFSERNIPGRLCSLCLNEKRNLFYREQRRASHFSEQVKPQAIKRNGPV